MVSLPIPTSNSLYLSSFQAALFLLFSFKTLFKVVVVGPVDTVEIDLNSLGRL